MRVYITVMYIFFCCVRRIYCSSSDCKSVEDTYDAESCKLFWDCTSKGLLRPVNRSIFRESLGELDIEKIGHTPLWLRIHSGKLYCVVHPGFVKKKYRVKIYRAAHYINRLNRVLSQRKFWIPSGTEWWTHYSDLVKVAPDNTSPPIFATSGAHGSADIAGIPFMSFSDKKSQHENRAFQKLEKDPTFYSNWAKKKKVAYFRGALSDCADAVSKHAGDLKFCARAKVIYHAVNSQDPLLSGISSSSEFRETGMSVDCKRCRTLSITSEEFVTNLLTHRYVLDFAGAGSWSRRMSLLLRSGSLIFQSESRGYQFYEFALQPGVHYIPFDPEIGKSGSGTLLSRLRWAQNNDRIAERIARRAQSFGSFCLAESSIDYFVSKLLTEYSNFLRGNSIPYPLVDLSCCSSHKNTPFKLSRQCSDAIEKCWG